MLILEKEGLEQESKLETYHQVFINESLYNNINNLSVRLLVHVETPNATILVHDNDLQIETLDTKPNLPALSSKMDTKGATLAVYPAVTFDDFIVNTNIPSANLYVYNQNGQFLNEVSLPAYKTKITTNKLDAGTYFLKVSDGKQVATAKVVKLEKQL